MGNSIAQKLSTPTWGMPVAIVTGANKGIGFGIVRALCKKFKGEVYLTARDEARGLAAVEALKNECLNPKFHILDIGNESTIVKLRDLMEVLTFWLIMLGLHLRTLPPNLLVSKHLLHWQLTIGRIKELVKFFFLF